MACHDSPESPFVQKTEHDPTSQRDDVVQHHDILLSSNFRL